MERISKAEYDKIVKEIHENGKSGRVQSIQKTFADYAQFDNGNDSTRRKESSSNSLQVEHSGENSQILRLDRTESKGQHAQSDRSGDSESGGTSKQGINNVGDTQYSLPNTDSQGKTLSETQQKFFADSRVRDKNGNLQIVYHGTRSTHGKMQRTSSLQLSLNNS